jgi:phenylacetate-CoA oxygenase PaaI subunit
MSATEAIVSMIESFADNKGALGRRYGEWAVSAPTVEAAVAGAAMAQDELGHARSTYPVLDKLGHTREDDAMDSGTPLPVLAQELPDWPAMIAANLVVDAILTTWVAGARDSSIEPLAQRAKKILQEEGAHRVHAEAWAARLCRAGGEDRARLEAHVAEMWEQAARWPGPDDDPGYVAALDEGMLASSPSDIRAQVRDWLSPLVEVDLPEPTDWTGWDAKTRN